MVSFQQLTGINIVLFYMESIFEDAGGVVPKEIAPIVIGLVQVLASMVTPVVVDRLGRKLLLVFSGIGETISLVSNYSLLLLFLDLNSN